MLRAAAFFTRARHEEREKRAARKPARPPVDTSIHDFLKELHVDDTDGLLEVLLTAADGKADLQMLRSVEELDAILASPALANVKPLRLRNVSATLAAALSLSPPAGARPAQVSPTGRPSAADSGVYRPAHVHLHLPVVPLACLGSTGTSGTSGGYSCSSASTTPKELLQSPFSPQLSLTSLTTHSEVGDDPPALPSSVLSDHAPPLQSSVTFADVDEPAAEPPVKLRVTATGNTAKLQVKVTDAPGVLDDASNSIEGVALAGRSKSFATSSRRTAHDPSDADPVRPDEEGANAGGSTAAVVVQQHPRSFSFGAGRGGGGGRSTQSWRSLVEGSRTKSFARVKIRVRCVHCSAMLGIYISGDDPVNAPIERNKECPKCGGALRLKINSKELSVLYV